MKPIELLDEINRFCDDIYYDFNEDNGYEWVEGFINNLSIKVEVAMGASKLVLIPVNQNYVLKIPFLGRYIEEWVENEDYPYKEGDPEYQWREAGEYQSIFTPFEWAAIREEDENWDYCAAETSIYELAEQEGLEGYFAAEYLLGFINDIPVYVQDKVCPAEEATESPYGSLSSHDRKEYNHYRSSASPDYNRFPPKWANHFLKVYGEQELTRLINFLEEHKVNQDWHWGNLAYIEDDMFYPIPILLDYSNYNDQEK